MTQKVKVLTLHNEETKAEDQYALSTNSIGIGKYAKVYRAVNMKDPNRVFAVKVIKIESEEVRKQYLKELKIIKSLPDCPNLVKIHKQHLESDRNLYIFQQYCESGTLLHYRNEKMGVMLREDEIYEVFFQISNGLITLLEAGIIHQDIKPTNILKKGRLYKLCDFGVSEIGEECVANNTRKGTVLYMPPQKLKEIKFVPNEKSDIYSLGICIYQTIFKDHPYVKKRTTSPKEYLEALKENSLKSIPALMKLLSSTSLRLENFLTFLLRMIDLNKKTRVSLNEFKEFIKTTEPFKYMEPPKEEEPKVIEKYESFKEKFIEIDKSIITYKVDVNVKNNFPLNDDPELPLPEQLAQNTFQKITKKILLRYEEEKRFIVDMIGFLRRGIDYMRKSNFNQLNVINLQDNFLKVDLSDCMISRYLKYLILEFSLAIIKKLKEKYQFHLEEDQQDQLRKDKSMIDNEFNKFLIESSFINKKEFADELKQENLITLWKEIAKCLGNQFQEIYMIKPRKNEILSALFCLKVPLILEYFSNIQSIFTQKSVIELVESEDTDNICVKEGEQLLEEATNLEAMSLEYLITYLEAEFDQRGRQIPVEIDSDSEVEILEQQKA